MPNPVNVLFFSIGIPRMIQIHPNRYGIDKKSRTTFYWEREIMKAQKG